MFQLSKLEGKHKNMNFKRCQKPKDNSSPPPQKNLRLAFSNFRLLSQSQDFFESFGIAIIWVIVQKITVFGDFLP